VNVGVSARLTRATQLDQWRRDTERPIVAKLLTLSNEAAQAWDEAARLRWQWISSLTPDRSTSDEIAAGDAARVAWQEGCTLVDQLTFEVAQLDLIAGDQPREVARALLRPHKSLRHRLRPASGADPDSDAEQAELARLSKLADGLIAAARADLGVDGRVGLRRSRLPRRRAE
jgi:hypothetical protein